MADPTRSTAGVVACSDWQGPCSPGARPASSTAARPQRTHQGRRSSGCSPPPGAPTQRTHRGPARADAGRTHRPARQPAARLPHRQRLPRPATAVRGGEHQGSPEAEPGTSTRTSPSASTFRTLCSSPPSVARPPCSADLAHALRHPAFPLALGRRSCVPTQPLLLRPPAGATRSPSGPTCGRPDRYLSWTWCPGRPRPHACRNCASAAVLPPLIDLPVTADDPAGDDVRSDVPRSFALTHRTFATRRVRHTWARVATPFTDGPHTDHDPFALLGW